MGKGCVGLDIGPQTLAFSANKDVGLEELAEGVQLAQDEIRRIKRSMDRSRKNSNSKMFTADGQIVIFPFLFRLVSFVRLARAFHLMSST